MDLTPQAIEDNSIPVPEAGCWVWLGGLRQNSSPTGIDYGAFHLGRNKYTTAHRASWEAHNGPIPEGMFVLHSCDCPQCVNPDHLRLGTSKDNRADAKKRGRAKWNLDALQAGRRQLVGKRWHQSRAKR